VTPDACALIVIDVQNDYCDDQGTFGKLGFHLVMFFFYLYSMIVALIRDEVHN